MFEKHEPPLSELARFSATLTVVTMVESPIDDANDDAWLPLIRLVLTRLMPPLFELLELSLNEDELCREIDDIDAELCLDLVA